MHGLTLAASKMRVYFIKAHELYSAALNAPVAQLDRVLVSETKGREFESRRARQIKKALLRAFFTDIQTFYFTNWRSFSINALITLIVSSLEPACEGDVTYLPFMTSAGTPVNL